MQYLPAESNTGMFGGNSNWRGPVWMPVNVLIVRALLNLYSFYGDDFKVECPTGSGNRMTLFEVAQEISRRLAGMFLRDADGRRPVYGGTAKFQDDPHWRDLILFYEYFHGDNGAGLGASHQTGWTGLVARLLDLFGRVDAAGRAGDAARSGSRTLVRSRWAASRWAERRRRRTSACPTPRYPSLFQVNTRVRLSELSAALGRPATLDDIPDAELDRLAARRVRPGLVPRRLADRRGGPARLAIESRVARRSTAASCPTSARPTSAGSCFAVRDYRVHADFGGDAALARLRARLQQRGLRLILDFVPNHMAPDHPWVDEHPDFFVAGHGGAARRAAAELLPRRDGRRAPHPGLRPRPVLRRLARHAAAELRQPGAAGGDARRAASASRGQCDGVRCDMAMLVLPEVFERTWGIAAAPFWPRATAAVRERGPGLPLPGRGLLGPRVDPPAAGLRLHLRQAALRPPACRATPARSASTSSPGLDFQDHLARFLENHDEPRAAATFAPEVHRAAAVITFLTPGPPLLPPGPARGQAGAHPRPPRPRAGRGAGRRRSPRSTTGSWRA